MKEKKPGVLSGDLMIALGMQDRDTSPPPWLINMQRYGPPPSYPNLRIPGLNAPIPSGASFGYQPGGWGKPPVDEYGRPLYGDVFGVTDGDSEAIAEVDRTSRWGELVQLEEEEAEEAEEEVEEEGEKEGGVDASGMETPNTLDGMSSVTSGLETPDTIDLRKRAGLETPDTTHLAAPRELYQVLQEKAVAGVGGQLFGSDRTYVLGKGDVQLSINPDDLEEQLRDKEQLREAYEAQAAIVAGDSTEFEDGDTEGKGKRKRRVDSSAAAKRYKDFKF
jgi:splicing factor 3B subunit 2